ncbi:MAG: YihY family inner membrane protein, partial [Myxococcota bacterium]
MTDNDESILERASRWMSRALSRDPIERVSRAKRLVFHNLRVAYLVTRSDVYNRVRLHAQALALKTLLAVVPLLAVVFSIFNGFGGLRSVRDRLETVIVENLAGSPEVQEVVHEYLVKFVSNVEGGALGPVSVVLLVYSVLSLLSHIEDSINTLFGVRTKRPIVLRFTTYWAVLTLGPLILGASLTLSGALQVEAVQQALDSLPGASQLLISVTPLLISWLGFTALYVVVPNTKISLRSAFYAALVAGTAWNLLKFLYTYYASHAITVQNIYGSLAAIPLFMLWIWWSWLLVLYGAQLAYAYENVATFWRERSMLRPSPRAREIASARVMLDIARDFTFGRDVTEAEGLVSRLALPRSLLDELL